METKEKIKVLILDYSNEINWFPALCNDIIEDSEIIDCSNEQTPWKSKQNERTDIVKELIHFKYRNVDFYYNIIWMMIFLMRNMITFTPLKNTFFRWFGWNKISRR